MSKFTPPSFWDWAKLDIIKLLSGAILDTFSNHFRIFKLCRYTYLHQIQISMHFVLSKLSILKMKKCWGKNGRSFVKTDTEI